ncbi:MAG: TAT-variant-translocated molybdopterin oxidoreductase [Polyangiales bacterium]
MKRLPIVYDKDRSGRTYWRSLGEQSGSKEFQDALPREFPEGASELPEESDSDVSRRSFLGIMGASIALASFSGCRRPEEHILPYTRPPEEMIPGKPQYYATSTTFYGTSVGLLVESHENRPTKIEGNPRHPDSMGSTTVHLQALVLDMYDPDRSVKPRERGQERSWDDANAMLRSLAAKVKADGGKSLAIVTEAHRSPTLASALAELKKELPNAKVVRYEPLGRQAAHDGAKLAYGEVLESVWSLDKAMVIAALDSDCFYTEGSPIKNARGWVANRDPEGGKPLNRMYAVESVHSVTGANAEHRLRLASRDVSQFVLALANKIGVAGVAPAGALSPAAQKFLDALAKDLVANRGASAVIVGERQPAAVHAVAHLINESLGNVGKTLTLVQPFDGETPSGAQALAELAGQLGKGIDTVLLLGGNPALTAPANAGFANALKTVAAIHLSTHVDETSALATWHLPRAHFLEQWSDTRAEDGTYAIVQPLIAPLYDGRSDTEIVRALLGDTRKPYDLVRQTFSQAFGADEKAWKKALVEGFVPGSASPAATATARAADVTTAAKALAAATGWEVVFTADAHAFDGRFANNGWLQEQPDPMTKVTWGNGVMLSPTSAKALGVTEWETATVTVEGVAATLPVIIMPGQADNVAVVSLGMGRKTAGRVGTGVGVDVYPLFKGAQIAAGTVVRAGTPTDIQPSAGLERNLLSRTQEHFAMEGRPIIREGTVKQYKADPDFVAKMVEGPPNESLWHPHPYEGHRWGMTIDLNACIGCNACMTACTAENNIPVVGVLGVRKSREMHWIRIDRYYEGTPEDARSITQPMLCQQCENAPCESVCPVGATAHSPEGLNDMAYNRCVGTRYCANNCPYKVRRFNFFNYSKTFSKTHQMQLNPDVTVRSRGVMEKCTWCVQRINQARWKAKENADGTTPDGRVKDGWIATACQQACPTQAITFGDYNDGNSKVTQKAKQPRAYGLLSEFNFHPRLRYLGKIRNPNPELEAEKAPEHHESAAAPHPGGEHAPGQGAGEAKPATSVPEHHQ